MCSSDLAGERTDGHRYLLDVAARGAAALIVGRLPDANAGEPPVDTLGDLVLAHLAVAEGLLALGDVAAARDRRLRALDAALRHENVVAAGFVRRLLAGAPAATAER